MFHEFTFTVYDSLKDKKIKSVMSWKFLMKKKPAIMFCVETRWRISKIETRDRKSTRLNSSHSGESRMPSSA